MNKESVFYTLLPLDFKRKSFKDTKSIETFINDSSTMASLCGNTELKEVNVKNAIFFFLNTISSSFVIKKRDAAAKEKFTDFNSEAFFDFLNNASIINNYLKNQVSSLNLTSNQIDYYRSLKDSDLVQFRNFLINKNKLVKKHTKPIDHRFNKESFKKMISLNPNYNYTEYMDEIEKVRKYARRRARELNLPVEQEINHYVNKVNEKVKNSHSRDVFEVSTSNSFLFPRSQPKKKKILIGLLKQAEYFKEKLKVSQDGLYIFTIRDAYRSIMYINITLMLMHAYLVDCRSNYFNFLTANPLTQLAQSMNRKELTAKVNELIELTDRMLFDILVIDHAYCEIILFKLRNGTLFDIPLVDWLNKTSINNSDFIKIKEQAKNSFKSAIDKVIIDDIKINTDLIEQTINHKRVK